MKKPLSVPAWFDNERNGLKNKIAALTVVPPNTRRWVRMVSDQKRMLEIAEVLAGSAGMASAWRSLDKRLKALGTMGAGPLLAHNVHYAQDGFRDFELMTPNDRRAYVRRVQKLSRELAVLMRPARLLSSMTHIALKEKAEAGQHPFGWRCSNFGCDYLPDCLEALADTGDEWLRKFGPVVPRPNAKNAERLFVMRRLTHGFRRDLGQPMRRAVFEIVGAFYDVSDLTPNDVTKLAP